MNRIVIENGGPAFPRPLSKISSEEIDTGAEGMSLRDYFAAQALAGMLAAHAGAEVKLPTAGIAAMSAFMFADAMLAERAKV